MMGFGNESRAPHGGIWVVGLISKPILYILAILIGTAVTAAGVIVLKMAGRKEAADIEPAASRQATPTGEHHPTVPSGGPAPRRAPFRLQPPRVGAGGQIVMTTLPRAWPSAQYRRASGAWSSG